MGARPAGHAGLLGTSGRDGEGVLTADGWLRTGDIGAFDADGFLKLLDRKKDMINVSGFKVFPNEVEDVAGDNIRACSRRLRSACRMPAPARR